MHYGGKVKLEAASIAEIYSMGQQFEAATIKQSQAAVQYRQPQPEWLLGVRLWKICDFCGTFFTDMCLVHIH